jgi:pyrroloquinoline quinone biosynthesis protein B
MRIILLFSSILFLGLLSSLTVSTPRKDNVILMVLGNVQDAGSPHAGCNKACCKKLFLHPDPERQVVSLGLVDGLNKKKYLIEATPDLPRQMKRLYQESGHSGSETPDGIFLTHAHIGHYSGLMYLGRESMNSKKVPVYAMPRMTSFLASNGPWSQLVNLENIALIGLSADTNVRLSERLTITPFLVPHRDEYSETVGYLIEGPKKKALFIPDIDKWEKWDQQIVDIVASVDYAFIDATFYDEHELSNRKMSEVPHPFVTESMALFDTLSPQVRQKIWFIHLNHTNPLLDPTSKESNEVLSKGYHIARIGDRLSL